MRPIKQLTAEERETRAAVKICKALRGANRSGALGSDRWKRALMHGVAMHGQLGFDNLRRLRELLTLP